MVGGGEDAMTGMTATVRGATVPLWAVRKHGT